jgi:hypothetical protein
MNGVDTSTNTDLIVIPGAPVGMAALNLDKKFLKPALYGSSDTSSARRLTWSTGNNEAFAANGKTPLPPARGWYIDQPDEDEMFPEDHDLVAAMEILCEQGLASACVVMHQDENDKPRKVPSWHLPVASLFVVCEGVPSKAEMQSDPDCRWGIAYSGWQAGAKSALIFQAYIKELMDAGYNGSFIVRFSSYLTDKALACLKAHEYVLRFADDLRGRAGELIGVAYYAYALAITSSTKTITAGKEAGKTKQLYYPVPVIPRLSLRSEESAQQARDFLESAAISHDQAFILEDQDRVADMVTWSVAASKKLAGGGDIEMPGGDVLDDAVDSYVPVDMDGNPIKSPF